MKIQNILENYEISSDEILKLLQDERACLKNGKSAEELLDRKKALIQRLSDLVSQVRSCRESGIGELSTFQERFIYIQQRFMKILQLDREVEKLHLGRSVRPPIPAMVPAANHVGRAYQNVTVSC
ncbi:MAG: hypothetical protein KJT03_03470 [Verrucomicrobiae bacterium]|nr:hypothetical protein [Verrucomicrobiae bacterium]